MSIVVYINIIYIIIKSFNSHFKYYYLDVVKYLNLGCAEMEMIVVLFSLHFISTVYLTEYVLYCMPGIASMQLATSAGMQNLECQNATGSATGMVVQ